MSPLTKDWPGFVESLAQEIISDVASTCGTKEIRGKHCPLYSAHTCIYEGNPSDVFSTSTHTGHVCSTPLLLAHWVNMHHARSSQINTSSLPQQSPISKFIHRSPTASSLTQMKSWAEVGTLSGDIPQESGLAPYRNSWRQDEKCDVMASIC